MKRKLQIFVSSTYKDLIPERQAAVEAILKAGHIPAGMELFAAGDESQWQTIKRWIEESDIYMLILGGRYGSLEPKSGTSYTELEYDYAVSLRKPHFAVVETEGALKARVSIQGVEVLEQQEPQKLAAFRKKVLSKISSFFGDVKDIKLAVHESIRALEARHTLHGWVEATSVPDVARLAEEIVRIGKERESLAKEVERLKKRANGDELDNSQFSELSARLKEIPISVPPDVSQSGKAEKSNLFREFYLNREQFTQGVYSHPMASSQTKWAFQSLGSRLEVHGLVTAEKAGRGLRTLVLSARGRAFLALLDSQIHVEKQNPFRDCRKRKSNTRK